MNSIDGALLQAGKTEVETFTGRFVDVLRPHEATICIEDIAQGLSMTCRYGGQIKRFYSVAEHAVLVAHLVEWYESHHEYAQDGGPNDVPKDLLLNALLHDAAEAYLGDVVAPLKYTLREGMMPHDKNVGYDSLTDRMDEAVFKALGVPRLQYSAVISLCDLWALKIEASALTSTGGANWRWPGVLPCDGYPPAGLDKWPNFLALLPEEASELFITEWKGLHE